MRRVIGCAVLGLIGFVAAVGLIIIVLVGSDVPNKALNPFEGFWLRLTIAANTARLNSAVAPTDQATVRFAVDKGQGAAAIGANLAAQGLIADADLFRTYVRYTGLDSNLQAGLYLLRRSQTIPEIARALTNSGASIASIRVIEGQRLAEIIQTINATPNLAFSGGDFLAVVQGQGVPAAFLSSVGAPPGASLEGFLFPATYQVALDTSAVGLRDKMLAAFNASLDAQARADAARQGLTLYQVVTLASIVEREAVVADERPVIAGVYLNRLRLPMTLDADPTIQYALGIQRDGKSWWPQITQADYRSVISPYNTYLNAGLPPSPISNPRQASILAVIYPRTSNFLFFRASCAGDGRHQFAESFQQQVNNACP
jgi:UPF0755 protein